MKNIQAHLDKIRSDAAECLLLSSIAADGKREVFTKMAEHLNALAFELEKTIARNDEDLAGRAHREQAVVTKIEHPEEAIRRHRMPPWLLVVVLGLTAGALIWTYNAAQRHWSILSVHPSPEISSAPPDNSNQTAAALFSAERAERKSLSEQVTALAGRLEDVERRLDNLKKARAETPEPLNRGAADAEAKPPISETSPPLAAEKPVTTVENPASTAESPTSLDQSDPIGPPGCAKFHSFDPKTGTYTTLNGRRRKCR